MRLPVKLGSRTAKLGHAPRVAVVATPAGYITLVLQDAPALSLTLENA